MILIRCTQRLLKSSRVSPVADPPDPPGALGEWYANMVPLRFPGRWLTIYLSADTLLAVAAPGRTLAGTLDTFRTRLPVLLRALEVPEPWIAERVADAGEVVVARTASRRVLGYMNDVMNTVDYWQDDVTAFDALNMDRLEQLLAETPYAAMTREAIFPYRAVRSLAGLETDHHFSRRFHEAVPR